MAGGDTRLLACVLALAGWVTSSLCFATRCSVVQYIKRRRTRHCGVLGLSALVLCHPYDLPDFMPAVLHRLCRHVNDVAPISTTVKATFAEFKRTHQDNWAEHKLKFTRDQLTDLTELLVSPHYYA